MIHSSVGEAEVTQGAVDVWAVPADGRLHVSAGANLTADTFLTGLIDDVRIYNRVVRPQNSSDVTNLDNGLAASDAASPLH